MDSSTFSPKNSQSTLEGSRVCFNGVTYNIETLLGSGLTSDVYQATASVIDIETKASHQKVAIKRVKGKFGAEFSVEAQVLAWLANGRHPNIIKMVGCKFPT